MNDFANTKAGHEFLYRTMPELTRNVKELAEAVKKLTVETPISSAKYPTIYPTIEWEETMEAIDFLLKLDRDLFGDLSCTIAEESASEAYDNDKSLHSLFIKYHKVGLKTYTPTT